MTSSLRRACGVALLVGFALVGLGASGATAQSQPGSTLQCNEKTCVVPQQCRNTCYVPKVYLVSCNYNALAAANGVPSSNSMAKCACANNYLQSWYQCVTCNYPGNTAFDYYANQAKAACQSGNADAVNFLTANYTRYTGNDDRKLLLYLYNLYANGDKAPQEAIQGIADSYNSLQQALQSGTGQAASSGNTVNAASVGDMSSNDAVTAQSSSDGSGAPSSSSLASQSQYPFAVSSTGSGLASPIVSGNAVSAAGQFGSTGTSDMSMFNSQSAAAAGNNGQMVNAASFNGQGTTLADNSAQMVNAAGFSGQPTFNPAAATQTGTFQQADGSSIQLFQDASGNVFDAQGNLYSVGNNGVASASGVSGNGMTAASGSNPAQYVVVANQNAGASTPGVVSDASTTNGQNPNSKAIYTPSNWVSMQGSSGTQFLDQSTGRVITLAASLNGTSQASAAGAPSPASPSSAAAQVVSNAAAAPPAASPNATSESVSGTSASDAASNLLNQITPTQTPGGSALGVGAPVLTTAAAAALGLFALLLA